MSLRAKIRNWRNGVLPVRKGADATRGGHPSEPLPTFVLEHKIKVRKPKTTPVVDPRSVAERIEAGADQAEGMPAIRRKRLLWEGRKVTQKERANAAK